MNSKKIIKEILPPIFMKFYQKFQSSQRLKEVVIEDVSNIIHDYKLELCNSSIIMGNGPSLSNFIKNHFDFIENKTVIVINSFANSEFFEKICPTFYVFADPNYWNTNVNEELKKSIQITYENILKKTSWPLYIFLPLKAKKWNSFIDLPLKNQNVNLVYYNNRISNLKSLKERFELYRKNKAMIKAQTVLVSAINLSLNLGFKENYLVGGDLSLHEKLYVNEQNVVCTVENHFYEDKVLKEHPFWKNSEHTETFTMEEIFKAFSQMFRGFKDLEVYSKYLGVKIYNIGDYSFIDAFERKKL